MQPPIAAETILQNRYRLLRPLGQGGFARTYLAEDQGRFKELCVLKEFIPSQSNTLVLEKSKELFQREAAILYQIQHPQIPQFRETFEYETPAEARLFLVQDYVQGRTYRDLLKDRRTQGEAFSEVEVRNLIQQVLPVLAYIHHQGIIHRDISPDNLIRRERDHCPVLIDFGVVKELATQLQHLDAPTQGTAVGKLGFAPNEQFQTGRAYPSSDLFSLAVTAVVLLTAQEPQALYDDNTSTWRWQDYTTVSPGFAQVLTKMLQSKPGDRYQSVRDLEAALQALPGSSASTVKQRVTQTQAPPVNVSQLRTMAVDRPGAVLPRPPDPQQDRVIPKPRVASPPPSSRPQRSFWESSWSIVGVGLLLAVITGLLSWGFVRALQQRLLSKAPPPEVLSPSPPTSPAPEPFSVTRPLLLFAGDQLSVQGSLEPNQTLNYVFQGQEGQPFQAVLNGQGVEMSLLEGRQQQPLDPQAQQVTSWQGTLPVTGDYVLRLQRVEGVSQGNYLLTVKLGSSETAAPVSEPTPVSEPPPVPDSSPRQVQIDTERVRFAPGESSQRITASTRSTQVKRYLVRAREGQVLRAQVRDGSVTLNVRYPDGRLVEGAANVVNWEFLVPFNGNYQIDVLPLENQASFTLNIGVQEPR